MKMRAASLCLLLSMLVLAPARVLAAPTFKFQPPAATDDADVDAVMHDLAQRILPVYEEQDPLRYLANLSTLQMAVGDYKAAYDTWQSLQDRQRSAKSSHPFRRELLFDLYAHARAVDEDGKISFEQAFRKFYDQAIPKLSDHAVYALTHWHGAPASSFQNALQRAFNRLRSQSSLTTPEALGLIQTYLSFEIHRDAGALVDMLGTETDQRRYVIEENVLIKTADGIVLHARVVRPKNASKPLPALFEFTIVLSQDDAIASAAHGYVGVVAYTRGTHRSRGRVVAFEHDGRDARAVIKWITRQPWSDGRVGMYGDSYGGFAAWAAAKHPPKALKAIATSDAMAPGVDFPMQGHIYQNAAYRWATNNTHGTAENGKEYEAYWSALNQTWYQSGKPYRSLDHLAKMPNRMFRRWLNHPSFDWYWQSMIPVHRQFARIKIPVLSMTGYYANGEAGSLYYYREHRQYQPKADHTLLIGPYDDSDLRSGISATLRGYPLDPSALVDLRELRYQWFDHIFKGSAKPAILKDHVNYEVMGENRWRHVASLKAMDAGPLQLYLDAGDNKGIHALVLTKPSTTHAVEQIVDFTKRDDADQSLQTEILGRKLATRHGLVYTTAPLKQAAVISGRLSGQLDLKLNKQDVDLYLTLYQRQIDGSYLRLSKPYLLRASYARDDVHRHLLRAGGRQKLKFSSEKIVSRQLAAGSRLVLVLGVIKRPDQEINYGAGKDVSAESIADAKTPLKLQWYDSSYVDMPIAANAFTDPKTHRPTNSPAKKSSQSTQAKRPAPAKGSKREKPTASKPPAKKS